MKALGVLTQVAAIAAIGLLLAKLLHATEFGGHILRLLPDRAWAALFRTLGLEGAETTGNLEIGLWLLVCLLLAAALVRGGTAGLRRLFPKK